MKSIPSGAGLAQSGAAALLPPFRSNPTAVLHCLENANAIFPNLGQSEGFRFQCLENITTEVTEEKEDTEAKILSEPLSVLRDLCGSLLRF